MEKAPVDVHAWLKKKGIRFQSHRHPPRYTAQEVAEASRVTGYEVAKVIVAKADGRYVMAVVPAPHRLSTRRLAAALGANRVELAEEKEFAPLFPGCEKGAMPPFGEIYGLEMIVDSSFTALDEIAFNAGTHTETLTISWKDFEAAARPRLAEIAESTGEKS